MSVFQINSKTFPFIAQNIVSAPNKKKATVSLVELDIYVFGSTSGNGFKFDLDLISEEAINASYNYIERRGISKGPTGYIFFSSGNDLKKVRISDLTVVDSCNISGPARLGSIVWDGGSYVYIGAYDGGNSGVDQLFKVDIDTMTVVDSTRIEGTYLVIPNLVYKDGYLYVNLDYVYETAKIDPADLSKITTHVATDYTLGLDFGGDGYLYAGDENGNLYKLDPADMSEISSIAPDSGDRYYSILGYNGYLYIGTKTSKKIYKIDLATFTVVDNITLSYSPHAMVAYNGYIYVGSDDYLYKVDESTFTQVDSLLNTDFDEFRQMVVAY